MLERVRKMNEYYSQYVEEYYEEGDEEEKKEIGQKKKEELLVDLSIVLFVVYDSYYCS